MKILDSDTNGLCLFAKRRQRGRFVWPLRGDGVVPRTPAQLSMLVEGLDWRAPDQTWRPPVLAGGTRQGDSGPGRLSSATGGFGRLGSRTLNRTQLLADNAALRRPPGRITSVKLVEIRGDHRGLGSGQVW